MFKFVYSQYLVYSVQYVMMENVVYYFTQVLASDLWM